MSTFINELTVMQFYIERIDRDEISFLQGRESLKAQIRELIEKLMNAKSMNDKIQVAVVLWKKLFEASMSHISSDKRGYDKIFGFFDSYVEFEELIFASDSFYRDHTLHCIWVYFLGEYVANKSEFDPLFNDQRGNLLIIEGLKELYPNDLHYKGIYKNYIKYTELQESIRCVSALTHDLGYPLKKIEKINKSIKKVLPYFAVNNFNDFTFEYSNVQQEFSNNFVDFISRNLNISMSNVDAKITEEQLEKANNLLQSLFYLDKDNKVVQINHERIQNMTKEERDFVDNTIELKARFKRHLGTYNSFLNDFESYQHGIMSAFLLQKNLPVFCEYNFNYNEGKLSFDSETECPAYKILALHNILQSISLHTLESFNITYIAEDNYLTLIDELEEFSRISRASQNREYVKEFCESALDYTEDGWLDIRFVFNNTNLDNLSPERAFKGRCKRFLTLFDIAHLSDRLKIRVTVKGELPSDSNEYVLEIAHKHADIIINGESKDIPSYLKSTQFYTKEEYAKL